jgi:hypothetical protein
MVATKPPAAMASTVNYAPCDLSHDVMVINGSNEVRIRDASEVTTLEEGDDPEDQTYYIICAATGVCPCPTAAFVYPAPPPQYIVCFTFHFARIFLILPSCLRNCPKRTRLPHFSLVCALPPQVSISKDRKHDIKKLTDKAFKFASNVYWVSSREAPDNCWSWALAPDHPAVKEYMARVSRDAAAPEEHRWVQRRADINDNWISLWRESSAPPHTRGDRLRGGVTFPVTLSEELIETWIHTRGTPHTRAN